MAAQFIGLHMRVVLRDPVGYQLNGTVRDVEAGTSLTLTNGTFVSAASYPHSCVVTNAMLQSSFRAPRTGHPRCESTPQTLPTSAR